MDQSYSESDVSLSPSQILERLHMLRQLQLMQQGKLQKQRLEYEESPCGSTITEIVSQFSNSTTFNTFRNLLESPQDISQDATPRHIISSDSTPRLDTSKKSPQVSQNDLIDGVSVLNISQESEFVVTSPVSSQSKISDSSKGPLVTDNSSSDKNEKGLSLTAKKQISLDDMPILSPRKDFEALIIEKLKNEMNAPKPKILQTQKETTSSGKRPFLRRGQGMNRFGINKNDLVIQNTHSLPWKQNSTKNKKVLVEKTTSTNPKQNNVDSNIEVSEPKAPRNENNKSPKARIEAKKSPEKIPLKNNPPQTDNTQQTNKQIDTNNCELHAPNIVLPQIDRNSIKITQPKEKHPLLGKKGKTWAAVLTKEQDDFLRELKQSDYYKNFASPTKSILSDISCDENLLRLQHDREKAEQKMFELLENKVDHESFNINNSFIGRFLKGSSFEYSGESTPLMMQKCLEKNPELLKIFPGVHQIRNRHSQSEAETCDSDYTDCCSETCTTVSSCCSCNTVSKCNNITSPTIRNSQKNVIRPKQSHKEEAVIQSESETCQNDTDKELKANMAEMNAKLVATSDLLKERLKELEDEIETFRKENANLTKMREEIDSEKQKFYEEKAVFEQKLNEEKILSEYYLAEEKDKLSRQKQIYDRQIREMRGRLNKKEKDEITLLKKEVSDLKEEIRVKDAKSTTITARLRNQMKIMEKERKELQDEVEKLKKENRRIQHSNEITRRLTNIKYLAEINKKLTNANTKNTESQVELDEDVRYKAFEIERQSRSKKTQAAAKNSVRPRAKSVPNLNVTSRYAKYFSQRDVLSPPERNQTLHTECIPYEHDDSDHLRDEIESLGEIESINGRDLTDSEEENRLERIYVERFQEQSNNDQFDIIDRSSQSGSRHSHERINDTSDNFLIHRSNSSTSSKHSKSPNELSLDYRPSGGNPDRSRSPISILSHRSRSGHKSPITVTREHEKLNYLSSHRSDNIQTRSKSPVSILSNQTHSSHRQPTVINREYYSDSKMTLSPEPCINKISLTKTDFKPIEIKKPDGAREFRFPNGNVKYLSADGKYSKFVYYNGDVKENFYNEGRIKYFYAQTKTLHTTHPDGLEVLEFPDGQVEKRYKDGSTEIRLPNGSIRYFDPKNEHVREEWRFPDGSTLTVAADGARRVVFTNGQVEVHTKDHKRREFPDGTVKLVYNDGTAETRYASGRVRIKDKQGHLIMDSVPG